MTDKTSNVSEWRKDKGGILEVPVDNLSEYYEAVEDFTHKWRKKVKDRHSKISCRTIGIIRDLPTGFSHDVAKEIEQLTSLPWQKNSYPDYGNHGYEVVSLYSKSGDSSDIIIEDCHPKPTPELDQLPTIRSFVERYNLSLMWVRLNKFTPDACFWEHRDYSELSEKQKIRLHVPISTSTNSYMVFQDTAVHLKPDTVWLLRPDSDIHGFMNGHSVRIHLIIDIYLNNELSNQIEQVYLPEESLTLLPEATPEIYKKLLSLATKLVDENREKDAEELLLKTFFQYNQPLGFSYDLVISLYKKYSRGEKVQEWISRKYRMMQKEELQNIKNQWEQTNHKTRSY
ncbi:MAG: aspartyl/asparaginyl beta-hydroxylase domain-containing protein [Okeania sp. SIO2C2]|uniref:aspartyl/asparaginyl beta-hydroxylase domain-containing protein n=1 Tax=Okeania sp. SIO2C2 TaxID=2607787 RepID=UPI0013B88E1E|nr:aspartyl/asparaginyl beta-hydroxylase domain-containing protein [Okeania sp. SIO2C2]NEP91428.1 aspartyl/asparaginyl beta-hydroxylase domain-containing protein [Okeania sp. SIO2C2]